MPTLVSGTAMRESGTRDPIAARLRLSIGNIIEACAVHGRPI
jgi:hypothetical protein